MGWLDALLGRIKNSGSDLALGSGLNFTNGLRAVLNQSTSAIDVDVSPNTITPAMLAPEAANLSTPFTIHAHYNFAASASDLALITSSAFAFSILRVTWTTELGNGATLRLFGGASGTGTPRSGAVASSSAGAVKTGLVNVPINTLAIGDSIYLHTDGAGTERGDVFVDCIRV